MNKIVLFLFIFLFIVPTIMGEPKIIKQNITIISTPTNFQIIFEDKTIQIDVPISVNNSNATKIQTYTTEIIRNLECEQVMLSKYVENLTELSSTIRNCQDIYLANGKNSVLIDVLKSENASYTLQLINLSYDYNICTNSSALLSREKENAQQLLSQCRSNLTSINTQEEGGGGLSLLFGIGGLIIGYFIWGKEKEEKEKDEVAEQTESGLPL